MLKFLGPDLFYPIQKASFFNLKGPESDVKVADAAIFGYPATLMPNPLSETIGVAWWQRFAGR
jgi:hypothetical protein